MKFIIKVCDGSGFELSRHEVDAEPQFSPVNDMIYFEFKRHYFATTKDLFDKMLAMREKDKHSGQDEPNTRVKREPEPLPYNHPHCSEEGYKHTACTYPVCDMSCPVQQAKMKDKLKEIGL